MNSDFKDKTLNVLARFVANYCIKHAITIQALNTKIKKQLVLEAKKELQNFNEEPNISRISLLTGIHRLEVQNIISNPEDEKSGDLYLLNRIINTWSAKKPFAQKNGVPKDLSYEGEGSEFASLVKIHNKDLSHYTILRELERIGSVEYKEDKVCLRRQEFIPKGDIDSGLNIFEKDLFDLINAVEHNLNSGKNPHMLHFRTEYDSVPLSEYTNLLEWLLRTGKNTHKEARDYLSKLDLDADQVKQVSEPLVEISYTTFGYVKVPKTNSVVRTRKPGRKKKNEN